jgi:hypothetical protein
MRAVGKTWYVENTWACDSCETKNKGRDIRCVSCGNPKEDQEKDRVDPSAPAVTDPELLNLAKQAPHWECEYCKSKVRAPDGNCASCGGAREAKPAQETSSRPKSDLRYDPLTIDDGGCCLPFRAGGGGVDRLNHSLKNLKAVSQQAQLRKTLDTRAYYLKWALGILAGLLVITGLVWLFMPRESTMEVSSIQWTHTSKFQERLTKSGEGWGAPIGAFDKSCHRRKRGTENCNPYKCNPRQVSYQCNPKQCNCRPVCKDQGNGFSRCTEQCSTCYDTCEKTEYETCYEQCDVYDQWCTYKYYDWVDRQTKQLTGKDHKVAWPTMPPTDTTHRIVKHAKYQAWFKDEDGKLWDHDADNLAEYRKYSPGADWRVKTNYAGQFWPLRPERTDG